MIVASLVLFFAAALQGLLLMRYVAAKVPAPKAVVFGHGIAAVAAIVLLMAYYFHCFV